MAPAPDTPMQPSLAKPRRRWWLRGVLALSAVVLALVGVYFYLEDAARRDWDAAVAETDGLDPRWRLEDIEADRAVIPDAENSAFVIRPLHEKGIYLFVATTRKEDDLLNKLPPPNVQLTSQATEIYRRELAKLGDAVETARKLKDLPRGRFAITFNDEYFPTEKNYYDFQPKRTLSLWLFVDALLLAQDGDGECSQAVDACRARLNAGRALAGEPFVPSRMIRLQYMFGSAIDLERVLAQGIASDEALRAMQTGLQTDSSDGHWHTAVRGLRAGHHHLFENLRRDKLKITVDGIADLSGTKDWSKIIPGKRRSVKEWISDNFPGAILKHYPDHLRRMNQLVEISKLPVHERHAKVEQWEAGVKESTNPVTHLLMEPLTKRHGMECVGLAMARCSAVGMACERHRLLHRAWPSSLEVLVEGRLLDAVPLDPIDGQPLRYRKTKDGVVIYSIGFDKTDNHGNIVREGPQYAPGIDLGFRLWDVKSRRQPPVAEKEEDR